MSDTPRVWNHPTLGEFNHDAFAWTGEIHLPAFARFDLPHPKGRYELVIAKESLDEPEPPSDLVKVAEHLVEAGAQLADVILLALWRELTGEGPDSGMWWHGGIPADKITQLNGQQPLEGPEGLVDYLELQHVRCLHDIQADKPVAEFQFSAPWEEEHGGMGVLVEEGTVAGIGYGCDGVLRFDYKPPKTKPTINPFTGEPSNKPGC